MTFADRSARFGRLGTVKELPHYKARQLTAHPLGGVKARMSNRKYMVIEHFRNGNAEPVYERFRERGRLAPAGLAYVASWVDAGLRCCYQIMETDDAALLERWMEQWRDLVDFEVHEVITSDEAAARVLSRS